MQRNRVRLHLGVLLLALALIPSNLLAQGGGTAAVSGHVTDPSGAIIPGAAINITNLATGLAHSTVSNNVGAFSVLSLPPAFYQITVEKEGFQQTFIPTVQLEVNQTLVQDFALEVGSVTETVEVSATAQLLQSSSAEVGAVVGEQAVMDLPLNGRNFTQLLTLTPGVAPVSTAQNAGGFGARTNAGAFSFPAINGQSNRSNFFMLDGLTNQGAFTSTYAIPPIIDAIQEFKVQSHNDLAEYGQVRGGIINIVSKSGTNEFHGSGFWFLRNDAFDARNPFVADVTPLRQNTVGAVVGGPVIKNRTFFFASGQIYRQRRPAESRSLVPTSAQLGGDLSSDPFQIYDPFSTVEDSNNPGVFNRTPFPNNIIPGGRLDQGMVNYAKAIWPAAQSIGVAGQNAIDSRASVTDVNEWAFKVDHRISDNHLFWLRYGTGDQPTINGGVEGRTSTGILNSRNLGINYTWSASPTSVFALSLGRVFGQQGGKTIYDGQSDADLVAIGGFTSGFACQWPEDIIPGGCYAPSVGIPGFASSGSNYGVRDITDVYQIRSNYSKIVGNHSFKVGGNWNTNDYFGPGFGGGVTFSALQTADPLNPGNTGSGLASYLLSVPAVGRRRGNIEEVRGHRVYGVYFQDTWKVTNRLTLNLGVRNDATIFGHYGSDELNNNKVGNLNLILGRYELQVPTPSCNDVGIAPCIPGDGTLPDGVVMSPNQKPSNDRPWNWQGRFGLAYRITDKMAFRGAYGIVYDNWAGNLQANMGVVGTWPSVGLIQQPNINLPSSAQPTPKLTAQDPLDLGDNPVFPNPTPFGEVTWYYDPALKLPYSQQYNLSFQYEFAENTLVDLAYVGSTGVNLRVGGMFNTALTPGPGDSSLRRPFPHITPSFFDRSWGRSKYNSFQFQLKRRHTAGFSYLVAYTFSDSKDHCSGWFNEDGCNPQDPNKFNDNWGPSAFNMPHVFTTSWVYEIPTGAGGRFQTGNKVLDHILGPWQLNGILQFTSGQNYHVGVSGDLANTGNAGSNNINGGYLRANVVGDPNLSNGTPDGWLNASAFDVPAPFTFGDMDRHALQGDGLGNLDLSIFRKFRITESKIVELRIEMFNATNSPTWNRPTAQLDSPNFGRIFSTRSTERQIQLGLKLHF
jgi:hypothetical protein